MFHIVESNHILREVFVDIISECGYSAKSFGTSLDYLDHMRCQSYQYPVAIFTDIQLPDMSGLELIRSIRDYNKDQLFVIMSNLESIENQLNSLGCVYLPKPFRPETLKKILHALTLCYQKGPGQCNCTSLIDEKLERPIGWVCPRTL